MFDNLKNLANLPGLMAKAREMQEKMKQMQDDLARKQVSADAGGGMVTAIVNGRMEVVQIRIDKSKVDVNDVEMLDFAGAAYVMGNATDALKARGYRPTGSNDEGGLAMAIRDCLQSG